MEQVDWVLATQALALALASKMAALLALIHSLVALPQDWPEPGSQEWPGQE